jgi:hypothetical protein
MRLDDSRKFRNGECREKHERQIRLPRMKTPGMTRQYNEKSKVIGRTSIQDEQGLYLGHHDGGQNNYPESVEAELTFAEESGQMDGHSEDPELKLPHAIS